MRSPNDLRGKQFGLLVALRRERVDRRTKWLCQCRCGKQVSVREEHLLTGSSKSCGCAASQIKKAKNEKKYGLVNQRFGKLHVLWRTKGPKKTQGRSMKWDCRCDCGKIVSVAGHSLRTGRTRSCGCLQFESASLEPGQSGFNGLLAKYKRHAEQREVVWALTDERFKELTLSSCYYCGAPPKQVCGKHSKIGVFLYNGVDRVNSSVGYVEGNVVPCCGLHNKMKGTLSQSEFIAACKQVAKHRELDD